MEVNVAKTKIEWCDYTWNPVWGCRNGCPFCYAKRIAQRFGKKYGMTDFTKPIWIESNFNKLPKKPSRIFVDSMSDIAYWKLEWIRRAITKMTDCPQHTFLILTKNPIVYKNYEWPSNCWLGVSITRFEDRWRVYLLHNTVHKNDFKFVSIEPLLDNIVSDYNYLVDWVIVGVETGRKNAFNPRKETIQEIVDSCKRYKIPLFMKERITRVWDKPLVQQHP